MMDIKDYDNKRAWFLLGIRENAAETEYKQLFSSVSNRNKRAVDEQRPWTGYRVLL